MKRNKENRISVPLPTSRQEVLFDREPVHSEDMTTSNTSNARMLDNLKIALFFSQIQCQMSGKNRG